MSQADRRRDKSDGYLSDDTIIDLFFARDETAITEIDRKYGSYLRTVAYHILHNDADCEECRNDTYLRAWETMPPEKPSALNAYLGRITRNLALNRYEYIHADKRDSRVTLIYDEAAHALSGEFTDPLDEIALKDAVNSFLASLSNEHRIIFLRRYWYMSDVASIARDYRIPEGTVKSILSRTRKKFQMHLEKEGIHL